MGDKHRKFVSILATLVFLLFCVLVTLCIGVPMIRLAEDPEAFQLWVDSYGIGGRLLFIAMVVLQVIVAFIPGEPIELAAGYAFGFWEGAFLTMAGILIGSGLIFALVRRFGTKLVEVFFPKKKIEELRFLKDPKKTRVIAFLLMLIPGTPKDFISYFAGVTQLTLRQWLTIVAIARVPSLVSSVATGAAAGEENYILSAVILVMTLMISAAGIWYYRRLCRQQQENTEDTE